MQITWHEMKKAIASPVIIILLILFIAFNGFQVISKSFVKEELKVVDDIIFLYGRTVTNANLELMKEALDEEVKQFGEDEEVQVYLETMTHEKYEQAERIEQQKIDRISLDYMYYALGRELESRYTAINMDELREDLFERSMMQGWLAGFMENQFTKWEARYDEIVKTGEYKEWFFAGHYHMHSELFRSLVKNIAVQSVMLVILLTALIANYEVEQRTQSTVYTTKKGRSLIWHKFSAAMAVSFLTFVLLAGFSLAIFFLTYDYSSVWQVPISSGLNWEYKLPYITWWPLTVWQYLLLALLTELLIVLIVAILAFAVSIYIKNSYFTWLLCVAMLIAVFLLPSYLNAFPFLQFISSLNIALVLLNPHMYFTGGTTYSMIQYFELGTILLWLMIALLASSWGIRRFFAKDVA